MDKCKNIKDICRKSAMIRDSKDNNKLICSYCGGFIRYFNEVEK